MKEALTTSPRSELIMAACGVPAVAVNSWILIMGFQGERAADWAPTASMLSLAFLFGAFALMEWAKAHPAYLINALMAAFSFAIAIAVIDIEGPHLYVGVAITAVSAAAAAKVTYDRWRLAKAAARRPRAETD